MEKHKYYVSVQGRTIMAEKGDAAYELEIEADEEDVQKLDDLFHQLWREDNDGYIWGHLPTVIYDSEDVNGPFDQYLQEIYQLIHKLGTPETKRHIESMNILPQS